MRLMLILLLVREGKGGHATKSLFLSSFLRPAGSTLYSQSRRDNDEQCIDSAPSLIRLLY